MSPLSRRCRARVYAAWVASLEPLTYQWQTSNNNNDWSDVACTEKTLTLVNTRPDYTGSYYRCVVTNGAAGESTTSNSYLLNVWNVANVPVISAAPQNQEIAWNTDTQSISGGSFTLTCSATVAQGADHTGMSPMWTLPNELGTATEAGNPAPAGNGSNKGGATVSCTSSPVAGGTLYTSTLTVPVADQTDAREAVGGYTCTWFNNQRGNDETSGYLAEVNMISGSGTPQFVAPQATSGTADVNILIPGNPRIVASSTTPVTKAVGENATFSVTALLNPDPNEVPRGSLVYVWQMTDDGGHTWKNVLSSDGTGQFTDTYTTAAITQEMYDNSTASNVAGAGGSGVVGNANTVYMYRCIVANRTTGAKAHSKIFRLIITADAAPVTEPTLESAGNITIEGTAPNRYATGVTVSLGGTAVDKFFEDYGWKAPAGYSLQIVGSDGEVLSGSDIVYTGCVLQLVKDATDEVVDSATIIVRGDVLGASNSGTIGTLAINQLVRMAQDLNETRPLEGIYEMAGDFNGNGSIDIADLVAEAQLLSLDEPVQK